MELFTSPGVRLAAASTDHQTYKNHACPPFRPSRSISVLVTLNETYIQMLRSDAVGVVWFGGKGCRGYKSQTSEMASSADREVTEEKTTMLGLCLLEGLQR